MDQSKTSSDDVILINPFRVPNDERARFLANYEATMSRLSTQDGFLGGGLHELLEAVHDEAFDFVNVNRWRSIEAFRAGIAAASPDGLFGDQVARLEAHPGLFHVRRAYDAAKAERVGTNRSADDRLDIMEIASRFETSFDRGNLDEHMTYWGEEVHFDSPYMGNLHDRDSYRAALQKFYDDLKEKGGTRHIMTNFEFEVDGDDARVRSYLSVYNRASGAMLGIIEWDDVMRRTAQGWRYIRRLQLT